MLGQQRAADDIHMIAEKDSPSLEDLSSTSVIMLPDS